jgi:hypothetical protein
MSTHYTKILKNLLQKKQKKMDENDIFLHHVPAHFLE